MSTPFFCVKNRLQLRVVVAFFVSLNFSVFAEEQLAVGQQEQQQQPQLQNGINKEDADSAAPVGLSEEFLQLDLRPRKFYFAGDKPEAGPKGDEEEEVSRRRVVTADGEQLDEKTSAGVAKQHENAEEQDGDVDQELDVEAAEVQQRDEDAGPERGDSYLAKADGGNGLWARARSQMARFLPGRSRTTRVEELSLLGGQDDDHHAKSDPSFHDVVAAGGTGSSDTTHSGSGSPSSASANSAPGLRLPGAAFNSPYEGRDNAGESGTPTAMRDGMTGAQWDAKRAQEEEHDKWYGEKTLRGLTTVRHPDEPWRPPNANNRAIPGREIG
ncbi:unnamed protein product [Amoebophrya sp. A120]|nr:unnamed protein product [Amoebophrya sp. A120]|eukprot:GSA120T00015652001.1